MNFKTDSLNKDLTLIVINLLICLGLYWILGETVSTWISVICALFLVVVDIGVKCSEKFKHEYFTNLMRPNAYRLIEVSNEYIYITAPILVIGLFVAGWVACGVITVVAAVIIAKHRKLAKEQWVASFND